MGIPFTWHAHTFYSASAYCFCQQSKVVKKSVGEVDFRVPNKDYFDEKPTVSSLVLLFYTLGSDVPFILR